MSHGALTPLEIRCIEQFQQRVRQSLGTQSIEFRLFGSRARGQGHADSDVDVLVLVTQAPRELKETIWDIANDLLLEQDVLISPLVMTDVEYRTLLQRERLLALDIEREGIPL